MAPGIAARRPAFSWDFCPASQAQGLLGGGLPGAFLAPGELALFRRLATEKRRLDWLAGRAAAKKAIGALRPSPAASIEILNFPDGRPFAAAPGGPLPPISISHCAKGGICAVSAGATPVGVDFEPVREHSPAALRLFVHPAESAPAGEEPALWQTRLWTGKEAVLKLLGLGLSCDPRDVRWPSESGGLLLDGAARDAWLSLGRPSLSVEHRPFQDCLIAFAHCGGE